LIGALRHGTEFVVVHQKSQRAQAEQWFNAAGHSPDQIAYVPLADYVSFTDWAEDAYVAVTDADSGRRYLVEPWTFFRDGDALIADAVEDHTPIRSTQAPLIFQGGNCLIGDDFWLIGKDYVADSIYLLEQDWPPVRMPPDKTPEQFVRDLFSEYVDARRRLIVVGSKKRIPVRPCYGTKSGGDYFLDLAAEGTGTFQPIFHIDMFITLLGRLSGQQFEVMVGDPTLANEALGIETPFALEEVYDALAQDLEDAGMKVHRNPLVHWPTLGKVQSLRELVDLSREVGNENLIPAVKELRASGAEDGTQVTARSWHHITWNNCLVENSRAFGKHVYLPTFGYGAFSTLSTIDDLMGDTWDGFGFEVHRLGDFTEFARRQGVVHCIKKYLERGN
jgi:hypothetical protein